MKYLLLSTLLIVSTSALAVTTIRGSKSNSSSERVACGTPACCQQHPNAPGCVGTALRANCPECKKNSAHATEKAITMGRDNLKPMQPKGSTTVKGSTQTTSFKEVEPTPGVTPTPKPVKAITVKGSKSNASEKDAEPTPGPTPKPVGNTNLNSSRSNKD